MNSVSEAMSGQIQRLAALRANGSTGTTSPSIALAMANAKASGGQMLPEPPSNEMIEKMREAGMSTGQILAMLNQLGATGGMG